jgi:crossover junction endodeoxyribonuclease RuvC
MADSPKPRRILGVDPGTKIMGYAIIEDKQPNFELLSMGVIQLDGVADHPGKLKMIYERIQDIIRRYEPTEMSIEAPFFGKNPQSMFKLGRAQGVAMAAAMVSGLTVEEYSPRKIKQSVTGRGQATKEQVVAMVAAQLGRELDLKYFDATDALATALCHLYQTRLPETMIPKSTVKKKKKASWSSFLQDNPDRIL